ncbi:hypothetical protein [Mycobacterium simulans]|uniref:hypothetical protein n=1 Tax=Mycobacterium simulans TaxID=627089 RepID=UPI0016402171|nr:hypothetical protein [Mycobacterium simulans]
MTDHSPDTQLETNVREFLRALNERLERDRFVKQRMQQVAHPAPLDIEDIRRYLSEFKTVLVEARGDKYTRIATYGGAILQLTDEPEITERVSKMLELAAQEDRDAIKKIESVDHVIQRTDHMTGLRTLFMFVAALGRSLPRNSQLDELTVELSAYCLTRFPPPDDAREGES